LISIKTLYILGGKITTLVLGFWGGGVGINFHRVSCCGFEIMNTSANDKNLVPGHAIGDAAEKKLKRLIASF